MVVDQLIAAGRRSVSAGLVVGSGGNLSARDAGGTACWITARGSWLDELDASSFSLVRIADGVVLDGNPVPSSEARLHLHSYRARADATALIHLHPQLSVLLDALGHEVSLLTSDHVFYLRSVARVPWIPPGTVELAEAGAAAVAGGCNCVILGRHGCSVLADSVELALKRAVNLEEAARATYAALLLGSPVPPLPPAYLANVLAGLGDV